MKRKLCYTVTDKCCLDLHMTVDGLLVYQIKPRSKLDMQRILGDKSEGNGIGEFQCFDAYPEFLDDGSIRLVGFNGPSGGDPEITVEILIPFDLIDEVKVYKT